MNLVAIGMGIATVLWAESASGAPDAAAMDRLTAAPADKCTAIAVDRGGTVDGSTMTTHSADCFDCDWRVNKVRF